MPKGTNQKFKLYRLAQIMLENTDEEHYITMPEIMAALGKYEITADRKSIYTDLRDLEILDIEVEGEPVGNRYHYHVINRPFELPELKLLVDAIQSSRFITEKKTNALIRKLEKLADQAMARSAEFVSLYFGEDVSEEDARRASEIFQARCPESEVAVLSGGQPVYYYIISME